MRRLLALLATAALAGCSPETAEPQPEAISLLGEGLFPVPASAEVRARQEAQLAEATEQHDANPTDANALIWYGRRTAYLGRYQEAIEIFAEGIEQHPADARMYRHRGHRYISTRQFDRAIADFERAAELFEGSPDVVEPDGQPNAAGIPTSTLQTNVWYHLGLAYYLTEDYENALRASEACQAVSANDDMRIATTYWHYMTLVRLGRTDEAAALLETVSADLALLENHTYHELLLLFKGERELDDVMDRSGDADVALSNATMAYGVGFWHEMHDRTDQAVSVWRRALEGSSWAGFGYIASEAEVARR